MGEHWQRIQKCVSRGRISPHPALSFTASVFTSTHIHLLFYQKKKVGCCFSSTKLKSPPILELNIHRNEIPSPALAQIRNAGGVPSLVEGSKPGWYRILLESAGWLNVVLALHLHWADTQGGAAAARYQTSSQPHMAYQVCGGWTRRSVPWHAAIQGW